jgi:hypothetical protein
MGLETKTYWLTVSRNVTLTFHPYKSSRIQVAPRAVSKAWLWDARNSELIIAVVAGTSSQNSPHFWTRKNPGKNENVVMGFRKGPKSWMTLLAKASRNSPDHPIVLQTVKPVLATEIRYQYYQHSKLLFPIFVLFPVILVFIACLTPSFICFVVLTSTCVHGDEPSVTILRQRNSFQIIFMTVHFNTDQFHSKGNIFELYSAGHRFKSLLIQSSEFLWFSSVSLDAMGFDTRSGHWIFQFT